MYGYGMGKTSGGSASRVEGRGKRVPRLSSLMKEVGCAGIRPFGRRNGKGRRLVGKV